MMEENDKATIKSSERSIVVEGILKEDLEKNRTQTGDQQTQIDLDLAAIDPRNPKVW